MPHRARGSSPFYFLQIWGTNFSNLQLLFRQKGKGHDMCPAKTFVVPRCLAICKPQAKQELSIR